MTTPPVPTLLDDDGSALSEGAQQMLPAVFWDIANCMEQGRAFAQDRVYEDAYHRSMAVRVR
jgi:hypothetical protein